MRILRYPAAELRTTATDVTEFDADLEKLTAAMLAAMYAAHGIGLAANQVGDPRRVCVSDISRTRDTGPAALQLVNPQIVAAGGLVRFDEGCLSLPGFAEQMHRNECIIVATQLPDGSRKRFTADGLLAIAIQHEVDHLDGKLFVDRCPAATRRYIGEHFGTDGWLRP